MLRTLKRIKVADPRVLPPDWQPMWMNDTSLACFAIAFAATGLGGLGLLFNAYLGDRIPVGGMTAVTFLYLAMGLYYVMAEGGQPQPCAKSVERSCCKNSRACREQPEMS